MWCIDIVMRCLACLWREFFINMRQLPRPSIHNLGSGAWHSMIQLMLFGYPRSLLSEANTPVYWVAIQSRVQLDPWSFASEGNFLQAILLELNAIPCMDRKSAQKKKQTKIGGLLFRRLPIRVGIEGREGVEVSCETKLKSIVRPIHCRPSFFTRRKMHLPLFWFARFQSKYCWRKR